MRWDFYGALDVTPSVVPASPAAKTTEMTSVRHRRDDRNAESSRAVDGLDCAALVPPIDPSPVRSPQAVHTRLLRRLAGHDVVEIGTRNGDGFMCFARVARSVVALEPDPTYCAHLRHRLSAMGRARASAEGRASTRRSRLGTAVAARGWHPQGASSNTSVRCATYQADNLPDADVYTWWQAVPRLSNEGVLAHLAERQREGHIRASAEAIMLFDASHRPDVASLRRLRSRFRWVEQVHFDEVSLCLRLLSPGHPDRHWCSRARGLFIVAGLALAK